MSAIKKLLQIGLLICLLTSCRPYSKDYDLFYAHLDSPCKPSQTFKPSPFFLVVLVNARHLDYTNNHSFFRTMTKHPSDGSKNCDVGHAWIYLKGTIEGRPIEIEGGHSGERGLSQARYFEGIMNYITCGYANPTPAQIAHPRFEPNPISYLWQIQKDGFFQKGSGGHAPTFAAKIDLTEAQFLAMVEFIKTYSFEDYSIVNNQCASFVSQIAALANWDLPCAVTMSIAPRLKIAGEVLRLWSDPCFSQITILTPDILERSLQQSVIEGRAQEVRQWYMKTHPQVPSSSFLEQLRLAPERLHRFLLFRV